MEQIFLIHVDVNHLVGVLGIFGQVVLDRVDVVVDVVLGAIHVAGKAAYTIVHRDHIGVEAVDQVVQYFQRRDQTAGRHVDIRTEGADAFVGVALRVGMYGYVAFVQVGHDGIRQRAW